MPIYEYEPTLKSEHEAVSDCCFFETLQSISEPSLVTCPTCGHVIHRAVSSFAHAIKRGPPPSMASAGGGLFRNSSAGAAAPAKNSEFASESAAAAAPANDSAAKRAARMAMRHICASGCRH